MAFRKLCRPSDCLFRPQSLAKVASGDGFLIQGGDCAESFDGFETDAVRDTFRVLLQMSLVLQFSGGVPVTKLGRIAGQVRTGGRCRASGARARALGRPPGRMGRARDDSADGTVAQSSS